MEKSLRTITIIWQPFFGEQYMILLLDTATSLLYGPLY